MKKIFGVLILIFGFFALAYPDINYYLTYKETNIDMEIAEKKIISTQKKAEEEGKTTEEIKKESSAFSEIYRYNNRLYHEGQNDLSLSAQNENPFKSIFPDDIFGSVQIKSININIPLYIGSSDENLARGACIMGNTSIPDTMKNTNSVIAAHRGWWGCPYFRDIQNIRAGDEIIVTTPWEKLTYIAKEAKIIYPGQTDEVLIQPGKTMITLSSCHPYGNNSSLYRYVVYCEYKSENKPKKNEDPSTGNDEATQTEFVMSEKDDDSFPIFIDTWGRRALMVLVLVLMLYALLG